MASTMKKPSWRRLSIVVFDILVVIAAYGGAFLLRFDFHLDAQFAGIMMDTLPFPVLLYPLCANFFHVYRGLYQFSSFPDLLNIVRAVGAAALVNGVMILFVRHGQIYPRSALIMHPVLVFLGMGAVRFGVRLAKSAFHLPRMPRGDERQILLVGAGTLGEQVARQMMDGHHPQFHVVGFLDDDESKWDLSVHGVTVLGGRAALSDVLKRHKIDEIVVTLEAKRGEIVRSIADSLKDVDQKIEVKIAPGIDEQLRGGGLNLRKVRPADLLNRKEIHLDVERIASLLRGKVVMITGAGGTIGSELARQVASFGPAHLVLFDNHSTSLFYREAEMKERFPRVPVSAVLGDVRDRALVDQTLESRKPELIMHAAAHKHVPQLEANPHEGIANNVLGTFTIAHAAHKHKVERFLLISTDKAVRPSSVMGATKRAAELVLLHFARKSKTLFTAVRFGNVLGSSGSVLEIFREQIAKGGPLTVTHADATRYFMTVEEAVQLVLQALALTRGNEIYVLNMGTPVRIMEMAQNLLQLSGLTPGRDIQIKTTGLRPGEKLHEQLMEDPAGYDPTEHPDLMILRKENRPIEDFEARVSELEMLCRTAEGPVLVKKLRELVPTFQPQTTAP
jgi:FlaA1/EpsC-like NDP-sugar epimerase